MRRAATRRSAIRALLALVISSATAFLPALAAEFCVVCGEPDGIYRCIAADVSAASRDTGAQLQCIQDIARRAGHKTCTIERAAGAVCNGPQWVAGAADPIGSAVGERQPVAGDQSGRPSVMPPVGPLPAAGAGELTAATPHPGRESAAQRGRDGSGQTFFPAGSPAPAGSDSAVGGGGAQVQERALPRTPDEASGSTLDKAGKAVGGAAKKTWECVSSLFSRC